MAKMEKAKLKATDLTAILFIKTPVRLQASKKQNLLKTIFNFILIKVHDTVGTVNQHIAVTNEGDVSLFLIDVVLGVWKSCFYNTERL